MRYLISVIIPVYNVERYLKRCIDSVIKQTYSNLEIILVDDGSLDSSSSICDDYRLADERVKVVHKENGGLSEARNIGLDIAQGDFILFLDSDDYIAESMCKDLLEIAIRDHADIVISNFYYHFGDEKRLNKNISLSDKSVYSGCEVMKRYFLLVPIDLTVVWNKLYKRDIFSDIRFPQYRYHEDNFVIYKVYDKSSVISYTSKPLYFYQQRNDSIMAKITGKHIEDRIDFVKETISYVSQKDIWMKYAVQVFAINCYSIWSGIFLKNKEYKAFLAQLKRLRQYIIDSWALTNVVNNPYFSKKTLIKYFLIRMNIFIFIKKMMK